jgi:hypothetical protein
MTNKRRNVVLGLLCVLLGAFLYHFSFHSFKKTESTLPLEPLVLFKTNVIVKDISEANFRELLRLRGEVGLLKKRLMDQERSITNEGPTKLVTIPESKTAGYYYAANSWTNVGLGSPHETSVSFLWALRQGDMTTYKAALGSTNAINQFPLDWAKAFETVQGTTISEVMQSDDGKPLVALTHQLADGKTANSWLEFKVINGDWHISSLTGYPIRVSAGVVRAK